MIGLSFYKLVLLFRVLIVSIMLAALAVLIVIRISMSVADNAKSNV